MNEQQDETPTWWESILAIAFIFAVPLILTGYIAMEWHFIKIIWRACI